jgi:hypothetical protein
MALNLQDYCYCRFPLSEKGESTITYDYNGINIFLVSEGVVSAHWGEKEIAVNTGEIVYATGEMKLEIPKERAIELLSDDLRVDRDCNYNDRIFNAENPAEEIEKIIRELTSVIVGMIIDDLNDEYERIKGNNFAWE